MPDHLYGFIATARHRMDSTARAVGSKTGCTQTASCAAGATASSSWPPYAGHPIQESIIGYILRQNDPKYRDVQWGDRRNYFISLSRSMAFSAILHTPWKIGPGERGVARQRDNERILADHRHRPKVGVSSKVMNPATHAAW